MGGDSFWRPLPFLVPNNVSTMRVAFSKLSVAVGSVDCSVYSFTLSRLKLRHSLPRPHENRCIRWDAADRSDPSERVVTLGVSLNR